MKRRALGTHGRDEFEGLGLLSLESSFSRISAKRRLVQEICPLFVR